MNKPSTPRGGPKLFRRNEGPENDIRDTIPEAVYRTPDGPDEVGNPWRLALERPIESVVELRERVTVRLDITQADREETRLRRQQTLVRLRRFVHPLGNLRICYEQIALMIHEGYASRNPLSQRRASFARCRNEGLSAATGLGACFVGDSGVGKSTAVEAALSLIPSAIEHVNFNGRSFSRYQIPYLKINCRANAKEFCAEIFDAADRAIGTTYRADLYASTVALHRLIADVCGIIDVHGVGLVVIDDIQILFSGKANDQAQIVQFITTLINVVKVPVLLIGTAESLPLFEARFDTARRLSGMPTFVFAPMTEGAEWTSFCERLWDMRVVRVEEPMPPGFAARLLELSRGITDIAVKLVLFAQHIALAHKQERLDEELLSQAYEVAMMLIRDRVKVLGDDPFEGYGDEHRAALNPNVTPAVKRALSALKVISKEVRAADRDARSRAGEPSDPEAAINPRKANVRKLKLSGKGGIVCALGERAAHEGVSIHSLMGEAGITWQLGAETAAV